MAAAVGAARECAGPSYTVVRPSVRRARGRGSILGSVVRGARHTQQTCPCQSTRLETHRSTHTVAAAATATDRQNYAR